MTTIEQAKQVAQAMRTGPLSEWDQVIEAVAVIDALVAALAERDAEIGLLNSTLESRDRNIATLADTSRAQRKVLTQAGDALNRFVYVECHQLSHHGKKEMHDFDKPCPVTAKVHAAITAIQEQLK